MNYAKINPCDIANGEGVRVSIFVSGCPHHCKGCFNEETWDFSAGQEYTAKTMLEIRAACEPDYIEGLSILGGEPLAPENLHGVTTLAYDFKRRFPDKTIWLYTGYRWEEVKHLQIMKYLDILVDGKFVEALKNLRLKFRGSSNQRIILVQSSLKSGKICVRKDLE